MLQRKEDLKSTCFSQLQVDKWKTEKKLRSLFLSSRSARGQVAADWSSGGVGAGRFIMKYASLNFIGWLEDD
ncbi:hypothetical protein JTE90_007403 [Oedothorax gibbosus]|uniref:Uncharacterized protein n=1 Tax=Oedothorax gibbosus TaxID=931172 RepID=A0AAV6UIG3_9ARAC|nr:hypothetical protein JTE90_007403 [Oedothorax gibbosus]